MGTDDSGRGSAKDSHYARLRRNYRDAKNNGTRSSKPVGETNPDTVLLYGLHSVKAAIGNPDRKIHRLLATRNAFQRLELDKHEKQPFPVDTVEPSHLDRLLPADAVHQGIVAEVRPLLAKSIKDVRNDPLVIVLDQITDPHNVGAIMRSAAAFGASAIITTQRHSPPESGVLAKAASGALDAVSYIRVTNLADAIATLHSMGHNTIGLDSDGPEVLEECFDGMKIALVLGAEGKGMRHKTRECVQRLARLDVPGTIKSLNVSNAAAIALYAARIHLGYSSGRQSVS